MLFNSYTFIFAFLPATFLLHYAVRRLAPDFSNAVLAMASLAFYGWWDVRFLPLLVASILVNRLLGGLIEGANHAGGARRAGLLLTLGVALNLLTLGVFKYTNFFLDNLMAAGGWDWDFIRVVLPIGISFFTFQQIAYLVDVRRGLSGKYRLGDYALFVSFFPQLIAGPIVHHREMMPQFAAARQGRGSLLNADVALGLSIFAAGLFKKVVIADNLAPFATPVFEAADAGVAITMFEAWGASLAYTFQLYFDFSGYSDMAIGLGRIFGIRLPLNFASPYRATSVIEFWRRWHMTLSRFLRDYLYFPLGGNRRGPARRMVNLMITMLLGGLWHGAGWGFVIWGGLHGLYLAINHGFRTLARRLGPAGSRRGAGAFAGRVSGWILTFLAVVVAWVFFRATTLDGALAILKAMSGLGGLSVPGDYREHLGGLPQRFGFFYGPDGILGLGDWVRIGIPMIVGGLIAVLCLPNTNRIFLSGDPFYAQDHVQEASPAAAPPRLRWFMWRPSLRFGLATVTAFLLGAVLASSLSEFLYFQF